MKKHTYKWDSTATLGLVTLLVLMGTAIGVAVALSRGTEKPVVIPDEIPSDAVNVELPADQLAAVETLLSPLLKGEVPAFSDAQSLDAGRVMASLLVHLAGDTNTYEKTPEGALLIPAEEGDVLFDRLFGETPPREGLALGQGVTYDAGKEQYLVHLTANSDWYRSEAQVKITSTQTLDDTVFVHAEIALPVAVPQETPVPTPEETIPPEETEVPDGQEPEQDSEQDNGQDGVASDGETTSTPVPTPTAEPEPTPTPEPTYRVVRQVVFTILYQNDRYTLVAMRDVG